MNLFLNFIPRDTFFTIGSSEYNTLLNELKNIEEFKRRGGMFASKVKLSGYNVYYIVNGTLMKVALGGAVNEDTRATAT